MDIMHDHSHVPPTAEELTRHQGVYFKAWALTFVIITVQIIGAALSGSLAILADVGHVVADSFIALFPLAAAWLTRRGLDASRVQRYAGTLAALFLLFIGFHVVEEALHGLSGEGHEHHVEGAWLFVFAALAAGVNYFQHRILSGVSPMHRHAAHSGYHFHVLTDMVKNILLPLLGIALILGADEHWDLYATLAIGALIFLRASVLFFEAWFGKRIVQRVIHRAAHALFR
jgi:cobalt-zinc-cadmium efflux system protein